MIGRRTVGLGVILLSAVLSASCRAPVDLAETVELVEVSSGWFDAGIVEGGMNKLVPSVSFRLQKREDVRLDGVSLNVIFRHAPDEAGMEQEWDDVFIQHAAFSDGNQTPVLAVQTEKGYTGEQSRLELLQHSQFRDVRARVFARSGTGWVELGVIDVERQLLTRSPPES